MMRKNYIIVTLTLLLFSLNFALYGQDGECSIQADLIIVIDTVIWDAGIMDLDEILTFIDIDYSGEQPTVDGLPIPNSFHIVDISATSVADAPWGFDVYMFDMFVSPTQKPIIFVFPQTGVTPITDDNNYLSGLVIKRSSLISGIATSMGVMIRQSSSSSFESDQVRCICIHFTSITGNYPGDLSCNIEDKSIVSCEYPEFGSEMQNTNTPSIMVYPNPVKDKIFIEVGSSIIREIKLFNLNGQIQNHQYICHKHEIQINQLSGVYILRLETNNGTVIKKIIVQ